MDQTSMFTFFPRAMYGLMAASYSVQSYCPPATPGPLSTMDQNRGGLTPSTNGLPKHVFQKIAGILRSRNGCI